VTTQPGTSADRGNLPGFLHVALRQDLAITPTEHHRERIARFSAISTQREAKDYLDEIHQRVTNNPHLTQ
jgi:phospholipase C